MSNTTSSILVASDNSGDAEMVKNFLAAEFSKIYVSTVPDKAVEDFELRQPDVLVLAFDTLEKAERYYLGLYRLSKKIQMQPHRTVILCSKDEVKQVSEMCMKQHFDDYILFWPMNYDAPRLAMSVHLAVRELESKKTSGPSVAEFAAQARQLSELEVLLDRQVALGGKHIETASLAMEQAHQHVGAALDGLTRRLGQGEFKGVVEVKNIEGLQREMTRFKQDEIQRHLSAASKSVQPLKQWSDEFRQEYAPHLESARALSALANAVKPVILVVDDDDFQHKMIAKILGTETYDLTFATSGTEAMNILRHSRPDLILMDVQMPDVDGLEMTLRIKGTPQFSRIPVMMISGKSEGNVVLNCLKAGAVDFVVKPFDRETLKAKVAKLSRPKAGTASPASSLLRIPV
jgi:PleD family two-component response regulator